VLVGETTAEIACVVDELASRVADGLLPSQTSLLGIDVPALVAASSDRTDFKQRLGGIAREAAKRENVILLIESLPALFWSSPFEYQSASVLCVLAAEIVAGSLRCMIASSRPALARRICTDLRIGRFFQEIRISPVRKDECTKLLRETKTRYETFYALSYDDDAIEAAVSLAERDSSQGRMAERAMRLLDSAGASALMRLSARPREIIDLRSRIRALDRRFEAEIRSHNFEVARSVSDEIRKDRQALVELEKQYPLDATALGHVCRADVEETSEFLQHVGAWVKNAAV
jgi:ATP-dependent Clp protease ATP-binding subunit ClpA